MKQRKIKKKYKKILFAFVILFGVGIFCKNQDYKFDYKSQEKLISSEKKNANNDWANFLEDLAKKDSKIESIMENKEKYPSILLEMLAKNLDMTDYVLGYLNSKGKVFTDHLDKTAIGEYPLLLQYDTRWGYGMYGDQPIAINGCGPTSLAMVIAGLTGKRNITPYAIASYAYQNGYYEDGTSWLLFTDGVTKYGIIGKEINLNKSKMITELEIGHPIICSMRPGDFTTTGHIITIVGVKDGQFVIHDPNSKERSSSLWSYEKISGQIKNLWAFRKL